MRLRFAIDFCLAGGDSLQKRAGMSDWAKEKVRIVNARLAGEQEKISGWVENRKLIEEQGPGLWEQLRRQLSALIADFNTEYGKDALLIVGKDPNKIDLRFTESQPSGQLLVWFSASTALDALHWDYPGSNAQGQEYRLSADASGVLSFRSGAYSSSPESIAKSMLDGLFRG
jgi:hypothetical protein